MRPAVLFLEVLPAVAGGQQVLLDLLDPIGGDLPFAPHVVAPGPGPLAAALGERGVPCHELAMHQYGLVHKTARERLTYAGEAPRLAVAAARLARRLDAHLLYANAGRAFVWGTLAALLARRPIVWHVHSLLADRGSLVLVRLVGRLAAVRRVLCVCEAARRQLPGLAGKATVLYNGVDLERFHPDPAAGAALRDELAIPADHLVASVVGNLTPHKGQDLLLAAVGALPAGPPVTVLVVGEERPDAASRAYAAELRAAAAMLPPPNRVLFTGQRRDMPRLYAASDVVAVTAWAAETTSLALQEGMACGRVVVAARTGGIPELVADGVDGFLVLPRDPRALTAVLERLRRDPAAAVAARALATARARFDLAAVRRAWLGEVAAVLTLAAQPAVASSSR